MMMMLLRGWRTLRSMIERHHPSLDFWCRLEVWHGVALEVSAALGTWCLDTGPWSLESALITKLKTLSCSAVVQCWTGTNPEFGVEDREIYPLQARYLYIVNHRLIVSPFSCISRERMHRECTYLQLTVCMLDWKPGLALCNRHCKAPCPARRLYFDQQTNDRNRVLLR